MVPVDAEVALPLNVVRNVLGHVLRVEVRVPFLGRHEIPRVSAASETTSERKTPKRAVVI